MIYQRAKVFYVDSACSGQDSATSLPLSLPWRLWPWPLFFFSLPWSYISPGVAFSLSHLAARWSETGTVRPESISGGCACCLPSPPLITCICASPWQMAFRGGEWRMALLYLFRIDFRFSFFSFSTSPFLLHEAPSNFQEWATFHMLSQRNKLEWLWWSTTDKIVICITISFENTSNHRIFYAHKDFINSKRTDVSGVFYFMTTKRKSWLVALEIPRWRWRSRPQSTAFSLLVLQNRKLKLLLWTFWKEVQKNKI